MQQSGGSLLLVVAIDGKFLPCLVKSYVWSWVISFLFDFQVRHCIEKGALHLYLVTVKAIDKNSEIMLALAPGLICVHCGENCSLAASSPTENHKSLNGLISPTNNNTQ